MKCCAQLQIFSWATWNTVPNLKYLVRQHETLFRWPLYRALKVWHTLQTRIQAEKGPPLEKWKKIGVSWNDLKAKSCVLWPCYIFSGKSGLTKLGKFWILGTPMERKHTPKTLIFSPLNHLKSTFTFGKTLKIRNSPPPHFFPFLGHFFSEAPQVRKRNTFCWSPLQRAIII